MPIDVSELFDWLVDGAPGAPNAPDVVARIGPMLEASGVRVCRIAAFVRTLHPHIMGRSFVWQRGVPGAEVREAPYAVLRSELYAQSPVGRVFADRTELRVRLDQPLTFSSSELREWAAAGLTDYVAVPMVFLDGQGHAITLLSDSPGGFTEEELEAIRKVVRPLSRLAEILALRRTAVNLLSAYVGRDAGERILQGHVQRGDTEHIRCVIWMSDLRGFTRLAAQRDSADIILLLNRVFDCQVPAVDAAGGEVLKFMGDGMLAIFPIAAEEDASSVARRALAAAQESFRKLDESNAPLAEELRLAFGIALHVGEVAYGNIGGIGRLDFTCIGPAVNLAARIEGLTAQLEKRLLLSEAFAELLPEAASPVGSFPLKGLDAPGAVYEPR